MSNDSLRVVVELAHREPGRGILAHEVTSGLTWEDIVSLDFRTVRVKFDSTKGKMQSEPYAVTFAKAVTRATAVVNGFSAQFDNGDHEIGLFQVDAGGTPSIAGTSVKGTAQLGLRDLSGNWDDPYSGWIDVTVIAEIADPPKPPIKA